MRKSILIGNIIILLVITQINNFSVTAETTDSSVYGVKKGDKATYFVKDFFINATDLPPKYGGTSEIFIINQFNIAGSSNLTAGSTDAKFNITINKIDDVKRNITYEISHGNNAINVSDPGIGLGSLFMLKSLSYAQGLNTSNSGITLSKSYDLGATPLFKGSSIYFPSLALIVPLIGYDTQTSTTFDTLARFAAFYNQTYVNQTLLPIYGNNLTLIAGTQSKTDEIEIFAQINGSLTNQNTGDHLSLNESLNFALNTNSGLIKFYKEFLDIEGIIDGNSTIAKKRLLIEQTDFIPFSTQSNTDTTGSTLTSTSSISSSASTTKISTSSNNGGVYGFEISVSLISLVALNLIILRRRKKY